MIINRDATTSSLLYNGRPPRKDVAAKLRKIAVLLKGQTGLYPDFTLKNLSTFIKIELKYVDKRTMEKCMKCITDYSVKNIQNGTFDVSAFCERLKNGYHNF